MTSKIVKLTLLISATLVTGQALALKQIGLKSHQLKNIVVDNLKFKDFDRDGKLSPFEDWRLSPEVRAQDLLAKLSLEEKAGLMMHGNAKAYGSEIGHGDKYNLDEIKQLVLTDKVNSLITRLEVNPKDFAKQNNQLQEIAESSRLGIPLTISIDPRNTFYYDDKVTSKSGFSQWPGTLGMARLVMSL